MVVLQEIFGLTDHIDDMCTQFAEAGFDAIAPGLFERIERDFDAAHDTAGVGKGIAAVQATPWAQVAGDVQAAIDWMTAREGGPVFVTGFCYGGAATWLAAARCTGLSAASGYYGRLITSLLDEPPRAPTILHYGQNDPGIPLADVDRVRAAYPNVPIHLYDAGHGFCRKGSADFNGAASSAAFARTIAHFNAHI